MADESTTITVATYEQIATLLSKLAVNYSSMASKFYDVFYSTTAQDISIQLYDANGTLQTYTIPSRAKDFTYILNGSGSPEGSKTANIGSIYQDTTNGKLYIKELGTGVTGWVEIYAGQETLHGSGSPEGEVVAEVGKMYIDDTNGALYIKTSSSVSQAEGWTMISANTSTLAKVDLSNLTTVGEAHFANPSLGNLNATGQAVLTAKEDRSNKITTITSTSTDTEYPSAKAAYTYSEDVRSDRADKSLSNLTSTGNYKILPAHTGNVGKILYSNGTYGIWSNLSDLTGVLTSNSYVATSSSGQLMAIPTPSQVGDPVITLSSILPSNCIWLEGAAVSRTTYSQLFSLWGTTYGAGNGTTTFNLPDFRNRAIWGSDGFGYIAAGLPNITGSFNQSDVLDSPWANGAFYMTGSGQPREGGGSADNRAYVAFSASRSSSIYGNSTTVQPPSIKVRVYARYQ